MRHLLIFALIVSQVTWAAPRLEVEPSEAMVEEVVKVSVVEASPKSRVKVIATMKDGLGRVWRSKGVFVSDEEGRVDVATMAPKEGSWSGVDPMGLFWSMELSKEEKDRTMFRHPGLEPMEVSLAAELVGGEVVRSKVVRKVAKKDLVVEKVAEGGVVGTYIRPKGKGPFPAVIVLGGACGGIPADSYVAQLANEGYAALGLAYFFAPGRPQHLHEVPVEFVQKGAQWLAERKECDVKKLTLVGTSMGGVYGLLAASYFPEVKGVVIFDGGSVVHQSLDTGKPLNVALSPFTFEEKPVPYLRLQLPEQTAESFQTCFFLRTFLGSYFSTLKDKREEAAIKAERINGPVLLLGTLDDQLFGSGYQLHQVYSRLVEYRFPHDHEYVAYPGAGHMIGISGLPYVPSTNSYLELRQNQMVIDLGGNARDTSKAQVDSWKQCKSFLKKVML